MYHNQRDPYIRTGIFDCERQFEDSVKLAEIAGLCHDLGHGPFSHSWDYTFLPKVRRHGDDFLKHPHMHHEARSIMLFKHMVETSHIDLDRDQVNAICSMIEGGKPKNSEASSLAPGFLFDVVANSKHGVDVDKLDYISRDVRHLNLPLGFDYKRLMKFAKVVDEDVCFHRKEIYSGAFFLQASCTTVPCSAPINCRNAHAPIRLLVLFVLLWVPLTAHVFSISFGS